MTQLDGLTDTTHDDTTHDTRHTTEGLTCWFNRGVAVIICSDLIYPHYYYHHYHHYHHYTMPVSGKMLKAREQKANREAGIGDENGLNHKEVRVAVKANCTICMTAVIMSKSNTDAKVHCSSKHPTSTFAQCFPGQFDPTVAAATTTATATSDAGGKKDLDFIRAEAAKKRSIAEGGGKKAKNKGQDLSFLDAALETDVTKIKKASGGKKKK
jgi:hypothetical protein